MDMRMPRMSGLAACRELKRSHATRLIPVVLMTGFPDRQNRIEAIEVGADDFLTKPIDFQELQARARSLVRLKRYTDDLESADGVIMSLALTVEARDPYTDGHCQRLASYAVALGRRLQLPDDDLRALRRGGFLHDLGKIAVSDTILQKAGPLTSDEFGVMKQHPLLGEHLCGNLRALHRVRPIVRHHHEHLDGSGYPDRLRGDAIPLLAQILGIVDVYDVMTTERPYRTAVAPERVREELVDQVRRGWRSQALVEAFLGVLEGQSPDPLAA
jgi:putative two-component system response regulator